MSPSLHTPGCEYGTGYRIIRPKIHWLEGFSVLEEEDTRSLREQALYEEEQGAGAKLGKSCRSAGPNRSTPQSFPRKLSVAENFFSLGMAGTNILMMSSMTFVVFQVQLVRVSMVVFRDGFTRQFINFIPFNMLMRNLKSRTIPIFRKSIALDIHTIDLGLYQYFGMGDNFGLNMSPACRMIFYAFEVLGITGVVGTEVYPITGLTKFIDICPYFSNTCSSDNCNIEQKSLYFLVVFLFGYGFGASAWFFLHDTNQRKTRKVIIVATLSSVTLVLHFEISSYPVLKLFGFDLTLTEDLRCLPDNDSVYK
ncbi:hypothetical protein SERLA73DRAFT_157421 [Serpula lacrymans var. lacrymans S7.3]|uniref:Uncharacterized protein n=1 Tax=Serpula lacrymans var. lacrymans (strain S7.3) TaxID=936435 RepID=F8QIY6_SERL3|nr:hypothetical protein SERLA73DRAFT_157421 [Serpula lacrymans var. lacrymans S7.3]